MDFSNVTDPQNTMFTDLDVVIPNTDVAAAKVKIRYTASSGIASSLEAVLPINDGVANINISDILGDLDTGLPGVSVATISTIGEISIDLLDSSDEEVAEKIGETITVDLKFDAAE